jgi:hypothetical protein
MGLPLNFFFAWAFTDATQPKAMMANKVILTCFMNAV